MYISATDLGRKYGINAMEMNKILEKEGFLEGEPGDYYPTEKGKDFVQEEYHHRGNGGYSTYNRYWTTRKFDDSIEAFLDIDDELIKQVKQELAERRADQRRKYEEMTVSFEEVRNNEIKEEGYYEYPHNTLEEIDFEILKKAGLIGGAIILVGLASYGIYKCIPKVKEWNEKRKKDKIEKDDIAEEENEGRPN